MPKGEKTIIWTAENDCLLLKGILIYGNVQVTAQAADEIAKHMGPNVPARAIQAHITKLKRNFNVGNGTGAPAVTGVSASKKRSAPEKASKAFKKVKVIMRDGFEPDAELEADVLGEPATPPRTPAKRCSAADSGDVSPTTADTLCSGFDAATTSKRSSPRGSRTVDYSKFNDPFASMEGATDEEGENVFGEYECASSEDSADSDEVFVSGKGDGEIEVDDEEV